MLTENHNYRRNALKSGLQRAASLVIVAIMALVCLAVNVFGADFEQPASLTVNIPESYLKDDPALKKEDIEVDIYRIAVVEGYDTFTLVTLEPYTSLQDAIDKAQKGGEDAQEQWDNIAQEAAALVKVGNGGNAYATGVTGAALKDIPSGMYLVLVHGKTAPNFYEDSKNDRLWTMSETEKYEYHYIPQMLVFPYKEIDSKTDTFNTNDAGEWLYDITIEPKIERLDKTVPEETTTKPAETTQPAKGPSTGDNNDMLINMIALIVSGAAILALVIVLAVKRKRNGNAG